MVLTGVVGRHVVVFVVLALVLGRTLGAPRGPCTSRTTLVADTNNSSVFYDCSSEDLVMRLCPAGLSFHPDQQTCVTPVHSATLHVHHSPTRVTSEHAPPRLYYIETAIQAPAVLKDSSPSESHDSHEPTASNSTNTGTFMTPISYRATENLSHQMSLGISEISLAEPTDAYIPKQAETYSHQADTLNPSLSYTEYLEETLNTVPTKSTDHLYTTPSKVISLNPKVVEFGTSLKDPTHNAVTGFYSKQVQSSGLTDSPGHLNSYSSEYVHLPKTEGLAVLVNDTLSVASVQSLSHDKKGFSPHDVNTSTNSNNAFIKKHDDEHHQNISGHIYADIWNHTNLKSRFTSNSSNILESDVDVAYRTKNNLGTNNYFNLPITVQNTAMLTEAVKPNNEHRHIEQPETKVPDSSIMMRNQSVSTPSNNLENISTNPHTPITSSLPSQSIYIHHLNYTLNSYTVLLPQSPADTSLQSVTTPVDTSLPSVTTPADKLLIDTRTKQAQVSSDLLFSPTPQNQFAEVSNTQKPLHSSVQFTTTVPSYSYESSRFLSPQRAPVIQSISVSTSAGHFVDDMENKQPDSVSDMPLYIATTSPNQTANVPTNNQAQSSSHLPHNNKATTLNNNLTDRLQFLPNQDSSNTSLNSLKFSSGQNGTYTISIINETLLDTPIQLTALRRHYGNVSMDLTIDEAIFVPYPSSYFHNNSSVRSVDSFEKVPGFSNSIEIFYNQSVVNQHNVNLQNDTKILFQTIASPSQPKFGPVNTPSKQPAYLTSHSTDTHDSSDTTVNQSTEHPSGWFPEKNEDFRKQVDVQSIKSATADSQGFVTNTSGHHYANFRQTAASSVFLSTQSHPNLTIQSVPAPPVITTTLPVNSKNQTHQIVSHNFATNAIIHTKSVTKASLENLKNHLFTFNSSQYVRIFRAHNWSVTPVYDTNPFLTHISGHDSPILYNLTTTHSPVSDKFDNFSKNVPGSLNLNSYVENGNHVQDANFVNTSREPNETLLGKFSNDASAHLKSDLTEVKPTILESGVIALPSNKSAPESATSHTNNLRRNYTGKRLPKVSGDYSVRYKTTYNGTTVALLSAFTSINTNYSAHAVSEGNHSNKRLSTVRSEQLPGPPSYPTHVSEAHSSRATEAPVYISVIPTTVGNNNNTSRPRADAWPQSNTSLKPASSLSASYSHPSSSTPSGNVTMNVPNALRKNLSDNKTAVLKIITCSSSQRPLNMLSTKPVVYSKPRTNTARHTDINSHGRHRQDMYPDVETQTHPSFKLNSEPSDFDYSPKHGFLQNIVNSIMRNLGILRNVLSTENDMLIPSKSNRGRYYSPHSKRLAYTGSYGDIFVPKTSQASHASGTYNAALEPVETSKATKIMFESEGHTPTKNYNMQKTVSTKTVFARDFPGEVNEINVKIYEQTAQPQKPKKETKRKGTSYRNENSDGLVVTREEIPKDVVKFEARTRVHKESGSSEESEDSDSSVKKRKKSIKFHTQIRQMKESSEESEDSGYRRRTRGKYGEHVKSRMGKESSEESEDSSDGSDSSDSSD